LIAAALAQTAEILLLDEPTTFLDPKHQAEIIRILRKSNRDNGTTILTVTHDLNSAVIVSERVLAIKDGRSVFQGLSSEVMNEQVLSEIYGQEFDFVEHPGLRQKLAVPRIVT
jgi:iron complex transport system ATP-binding protein